jgi:hypothetical protein
MEVYMYIFLPKFLAFKNSFSRQRKHMHMRSIMPLKKIFGLTYARQID